MLEFGLHANVSTHRDGHTLDLFITWMSDNTTLDEQVASYYISDHTFVVMETITYWKYKQLDIEKFKNDIEQSCLYTMTESTGNEVTCDIETMTAPHCENHG